MTLEVEIILGRAKSKIKGLKEMKKDFDDEGK